MDYPEVINHLLSQQKIIEKRILFVKKNLLRIEHVLN